MVHPNGYGGPLLTNSSSSATGFQQEFDMVIDAVEYLSGKSFRGPALVAADRSHDPTWGAYGIFPHALLPRQGCELPREGRRFRCHQISTMSVGKHRLEKKLNLASAEDVWVDEAEAISGH